VHLRLVAFVGHDLHLKTYGNESTTGFDVIKLFSRPIGHITFGNGSAGHRCCLGSTIGLPDGELVFFIEINHELSWNRRSATCDGFQRTEVVPSPLLEVVMQQHPDSGDPGGEGNLFLDNGMAEFLHIDYLAAGKHLLAAKSNCSKGSAPGVSMEHGNDVEDDIRFICPQGYGNSKGMEENGSMAVYH